MMDGHVESSRREIRSARPEPDSDSCTGDGPPWPSCALQIQEQIGSSRRHERREDIVSYGVFTTATTSSVPANASSPTRPAAVTNREVRWLPDDLFVTVDGKDADRVIIPPNSFALAETVEWIDAAPPHRHGRNVGMDNQSHTPDSSMFTILNLRSDARRSRSRPTTPLPVTVYANEGIAQMLFFTADRECTTS